VIYLDHVDADGRGRDRAAPGLLPSDRKASRIAKSSRVVARYAIGIMGDGERKSAEPIASRTCGDPANPDAAHQRLLHFVSNRRGVIVKFDALRFGRLRPDPGWLCASARPDPGWRTAGHAMAAVAEFGSRRLKFQQAGA
jgi:hypothetical protein